MENTKPKVAFFDFASCEGCQLIVLEMEEKILDVLAHIDIVEFREAMTDRYDGIYDVAFIEGSITRQKDIERLKRIRERTKVLVALGACADTGGLNCLKNQFSMDESLEAVYGSMGRYFRDTIPARPVHAVVPVEYHIPGCPINPNEFLKVVQAILMGKRYDVPAYPVCAECKLNENLCVYEKGRACLGPITRAGCDAKCPTYGQGCEGCRGFVEDPNRNAQQDVMTKYGLTVEEITGRYKIFEGWTGEEKEVET